MISNFKFHISKDNQISNFKYFQIPKFQELQLEINKSEL